MSSSISDEAFLKFLKYNLKHSPVLVPKIDRNFTMVSDRFRFIKHKIWHCQFSKDTECGQNYLKIYGNLQKEKELQLFLLSIESLNKKNSAQNIEKNKNSAQKIEKNKNSAQNLEKTKSQKKHIFQTNTADILEKIYKQIELIKEVKVKKTNCIACSVDQRTLDEINSIENESKINLGIEEIKVDIEVF